MEETNPEKPEKTGTFTWLKKWVATLVSLLLVIAIIAAVLYLYRQKPDIVDELKVYGYLGAFLILLISSATIVVPVPGLIIVFALGALLNPFLLGLVSGVGGTIGEMTGYLLGYSGRAAIKNISLYNRMEKWMRRWGGVTIFVLAVIPNPVFDVAGAVAGALRFPVWKFCVYGGAGRIIKNTLVAFAGAWGLEFVLRFIS
jgi:uncharacterized membrane protein YdjX (TVP38/TMEM64 family)